MGPVGGGRGRHRSGLLPRPDDGRRRFFPRGAGRGAVDVVWERVGGDPTSLSALARYQVLVYPSEGEAIDAFTSIDAELFAACVAPSVTPGAADEIEVVKGPEYDSGDESASFSVDLDDFVFFEGNDNSHMSDLIVVRVDNVVLVFQFIYGGQFFEGFDTSELQRQTVEQVTADVEDAM